MSAVEHLVEVGGEDLLLRPDDGKLLRQARLFQLARERAVGLADVKIADELLRDRRAALHNVPGCSILEERTCDALVVERAVLPETRVLDRHRGLRQPRRD